jgi:hypothetical protein
MTTINYTPKDALNNPPANQKASTVLLKEAVQSALDTDIAAATLAATNARRAGRTININLPNDAWTGDARTGYAVMPVAGTVTRVEFVALNNASAAGAVTATVTGGANALLASAIDLKTGINDTLKAGTLTATPAHLTLAAGALIKVAAAGGTVTGGAGLTCIVTLTPT